MAHTQTAPLVLIFGALAASAPGQISPDAAAKLRSVVWTERAEAYRLLAAKKSRSPEEDAALVALLLREETPAPGPPAAPHEPDADLDNDHNPDPGLTQYMDSLVNTVTEIADKGPQRSDVWPGLLAAASYNGNSVMMPLFARHADKTAPYFLAAARGSIPGGGRADALIGLAKIVSYERDPATKHHLSSANVQLLDQTIRDMLSDANVLVKMQALTAVGIIGGVDDLNLLDKIASVDPYYDSEHDFYPYRVSARLAAENIRRRLATPKNANQ